MQIFICYLPLLKLLHMKHVLLAVLLICVSFNVTAQSKQSASKSKNFKDYKARTVPEFALNALASIDPADADKLDALNITEFSSAMPGGLRVVPDARIL